MAGGEIGRRSPVAVSRRCRTTCSGAALGVAASNAGERFPLHFTDSGVAVTGDDDRCGVAADPIPNPPVHRGRHRCKL
jgi:hypothetical protein